MLHLILAVASSAMVSVTMRFSESKVKNGTAMLSVNYLMCLALAWFDGGCPGPIPDAPGLGLTLALGGINGLLYLAGFVLLQRSIHKNGVVLSSTFMKLGLLVSILIAVVFFGELPTVPQLLGFLIAVGAIVLINYRPTGEKAGNILGLLALMGANGLADGMSKCFEALGNEALSGHFLLYTFAAAFLCCLTLAWSRRQARPGKWELAFGALIGIPNFYSAKFLLGALQAIPAVIVYPAANVGTILTVTLAGVLLFREKLRARQWLALTLILIALALLNL